MRANRAANQIVGGGKFRHRFGMTPLTIFGLILRTFGLFLVYRGFGALTLPLAALLSGQVALLAWLAPTIFISAGAYFLRGAPELMQFCYPAED